MSRTACNTDFVHQNLLCSTGSATARFDRFRDHFDVDYAQCHLERIPRLRGKGGHRIQYRHIIDQLVRKPGAFANYRYRDDLFPTTHFRVAYDLLRKTHVEAAASREYLGILELAAKESEVQVDAILRRLIDTSQRLSADRVKARLAAGVEDPGPAVSVTVPPIDLCVYDSLLSSCHGSQAVSL